LSKWPPFLRTRHESAPRHQFSTEGRLARLLTLGKDAAARTLRQYERAAELFFWHSAQGAADARRCNVPTVGQTRSRDIDTMKSAPSPTVTTAPPVEQSYTALKGVFEQALALELMLAQRKLAKLNAQAQSQAGPDSL